MTNAEFQQRLEKIYKKYPLIAKSAKKSINELIFVLRNDDRVPDYCLNINSKSQGFSFGLLKESFFPSMDLALKINSLEYEEYPDSEYPCLIVYTD